MWNLKRSTNFDFDEDFCLFFRDGNVNIKSKGCVSFRLRKENVKMFSKKSCCSFLLKSIQAVDEVVGKLHLQVLAGVLPTGILLEQMKADYFRLAYSYNIQSKSTSDLHTPRTHSQGVLLTCILLGHSQGVLLTCILLEHPVKEYFRLAYS
jgi:hypothetical protein